MRRDQLVDLNAFLTIADEGSFTRAAARLGTSQSALSHTIRRLEARLGVRLLTRTTRRVAATDAGERLLATLRPALAGIDAELTALGDLRATPAGTIRITASDHAARTILWPALERLLPAYPDVHVEIRTDSSFADIVAERLDAGVRLGEAVARDMIAVPIGPPLRMLVVAAPALLARVGVPATPQQLSGERCVNLRMTGSGSLYAWEFEKDGRELKVRVDGQLIFNSTDLIVRAAIAGFGFAFVMADQAAAALADGRLVAVLEDWCPPFPGYHLYYPSRRQPSAAFTLLVDALRHRA